MPISGRPRSAASQRAMSKMCFPIPRRCVFGAVSLLAPLRNEETKVMATDPIVIVSVARTPMGALQGELKDFAAPQLGAAAICAALERAGMKPEQVQEVLMGCVLPAGQGQAPARQASLGAGLPLAAGCTTINKMCGSGMKAAMFANDLLISGSSEIIVAGGMGFMTNSPHLSPKSPAA